MVDPVVPLGVAWTIALLWVGLGSFYGAFMISTVLLTLSKLLLPPGNFVRLAANFCWYVTRWPCLVYIFLDPVFQLVMFKELDWGSIVLYDVIGFVLWWLNRDLGDDDKWRDLKKRAAEKVAALGRKLVVVPAQPEAA